MDPAPLHTLHGGSFQDKGIRARPYAHNAPLAFAISHTWGLLACQTQR